MPSEISYCEAVKEHGSQRAAARYYNMPISTFRDRLNEERSSHPVRDELEDGVFTPETLGGTHVEDVKGDAVDFWSSNGSKWYILTSAQNNVRVHTRFLNNLKAIGAELQADILVSCTVYDKQGYRGVVRKGETALRQEVWWDTEIKDYLVNQRVRLAPRLAFCGELDILASAADPTSSMDAYCGRSSLIIPHNKFAMRCVSSRKEHLPKEIHTTGSVTTPRFVARKTGQLAAFHHVVGALLVRVDASGGWTVNHINAEEDGSFYVLAENKIFRAERGEIREDPEGVAVLVAGDLHLPDWDAVDSLNRAIALTEPGYVVLHDMLDLRCVNHHDTKNPFAVIRRKSLAQELQEASDQYEGIVRRGSRRRFYVAASNHDDFLRRWVHETDWKKDPDNARLYLKLAHAMLTDADTEAQPLQWLLRDYLPVAREHTKFLGVDESLEFKGIECGMHGHLGPSGTRGSPKALAKLGFRSFTAHTHTPSIVNGCYTVGVGGSLDHGYNRGPSNWMRAHGVIFQNGKRAFVWDKGSRSEKEARVG
jgi:hypothetical protein